MVNKDLQIKKLKASNDALENYFSNTIIPQLYVDGNLILRKFTPPAMKQFNLSYDLLGKSIIDIKDNFRFPSIVDNINQVLESHSILEKEIQTTDLRWYQMNVIPYMDGKKKTANGAIITFVEITARIKDLKEQEKLIAEHEILLDTISHDIKTSLTSLMLSIEVFKRIPNTSPAKLDSLLKNIEVSVKKVHSIISELTHTREDDHKYKATEELLSIENILEDVRLTMMDMLQETGTIIRTEIEASEVLFSRRKLRSIIYNLVNNAIKYRSPGKKPDILIKTVREDGFVVISVKDNSIGIPSDKLDAIFQKYFRVQNNVEGTGIGLYLVNEIVKGAGGKVTVESELGKGSEFKVYLADPNIAD